MLQPNSLPCYSPWPSGISGNTMTIIFLLNFLRAKFSVPKKVSTKMKKRVKNRCLMCKYPKNDVLANVWKFRKI